LARKKFADPVINSYFVSIYNKEFFMKKHLKFFLGTTLLMGGLVMLVTACFNPLTFDPENPNAIKLPDQISTTDITSAVLLLTNRSKTVDVTNVIITQPEWQPPAGDSNAQPPSVSFANKPKRLEKKAQYLAPSDKSYQVVIDYAYDAINNTPAGTGRQTLSIPLPLPKQIVEYIIYRSDKGDVIIDKEAKDPDPGDTGNPAVDPFPGEGSSPAVIPPEYRNIMATFVVVSMTNSQMIDSVNFKMGESGYTMGRIAAHDKQSIALGQGTWETRLTYTRNGEVKTLGPVNSIVVPSNDPQSIKEHYLYFYLNKKGDYAISQTWPPFPNDASEEDILPMDNGHGRGLIKIVNNSYAMAEMVTIHNLRNISDFPMNIDYGRFTPSVPVQYNQTGYVDVIGTEDFPIEAHGDYLIQVSLGTYNNYAIIERKAYIKDQIVTIVITENDLDFSKAQGAKITLENKTSNWSVEIINMAVRNKTNTWQSSYYTTSTWEPSGSITKDRSADQQVMSSTAMPIAEGVEFEALVTIYGYGVSETITKSFSPAVLYSELSPDKNTRTITITDSDVPQSIKDAAISYQGANVILQNKVASWSVDIVGMTVRNKNRTTESSYYNASTWQPKAFIGKNQSAAQTVMSSTAMPITSTAEFEAQILINGYGKIETITKAFSPAILYSALPPEQNTRTITVTDSDIPQSIKDAYIYTRGAKFTIENATNQKPVQIIGVAIKNKTNPIQYTFYGESDWAPHTAIYSNGKATFMVNSTVAMPITETAEFDAVVFIFANNTTVGVPKSFSPSVLYSDLDHALNTRIIRIEDADVPPELEPPVVVPPTTGTIGARVTLENSITSWPVQIIGMTVQNKARNSEYSSYDRNSWTPHNQIDRNGKAVQMVYNSTSMPITSGDLFEAVITLNYNGTTATVTRDFSPDTKLYSTNAPDQNPRKITITDTDVPQTIIDAYIHSRGASVTIDNQVKTSWPVQITEMKVQNKTNHSQSTNYSFASWEPKKEIRNGQDAVQMVYSSTSMLISPGVQFEAEITIFGNGQSTTVTKAFDPAVLYSDLDPAQNTRTIKITDSDIPTELQTPPHYETGIPGLDGSTPIGKEVSIDGLPWYVADKTVIGGKTYDMLVCKFILDYNVAFNDPRNSNYNGSNLQAKMTGLYNRMVDMKKIAVLANLGDHSQGFITQPTTTMAGTKIIDVFFAPTYRDVLNIGAQAYRYDSKQYWTRSPITRETAFEVNCNGKIIGPAVTNAYSIGAVPCVWVRVE
jgi:hypothetical protein